ncbi:Type III effector HopY1 [Pseudomonas coronafaciens pv. atropurpurea]|uniref:type III effector n=1 Tax=Pseudomonas coronafaciens TaxID=53409 RepID=UPI0006D6330F|nr:type III effector [Pseudomonas coronafaciens]KPW37124.1 Type III effector HopY1 [Pseudomonas coronafaciens pv. atropurpurea]RMT62440.1 Type III effector HopY1 [Pseudomonas coronafaciens pv. atropurpurea]
MNITSLTSTAGKSPTAQGTEKISIPDSSRMINAVSTRWLNRNRSVIGNHISTSIEKGKLFELASLGDNMFGVPAIAVRNSTYRPVLRFEPDHNQDLNLVEVSMQDSAGKLNPWQPSPDEMAPPSPASLPDAQASSASSSLPRMPPAGATLSSLGTALNQAQRHSARVDKSVARSSGQDERNGARINAKQSKPIATKDCDDPQTTHSDLDRQQDADPRPAEGMNSMGEHQNEMHHAEALLKAKSDLQTREAMHKQHMDVLDAIQSGREDSFDKKISATDENAKGINYV